jgi:hypothetical protein
MYDCNCPVCGAEANVYEFFEPDEAETLIETDWNHEEGIECIGGCNRYTRSYWVAFCYSCDSEFEVLDSYCQPCNANGYSLQIMVFSMGAMPTELYRSWMQKDKQPARGKNRGKR